MKNLIVLLIFGFSLTAPFQALAVPGNTVSAEAKWLKNHPFFPAKSFHMRMEEFATFGVSRPINEGRTIDFKGYFYDGGGEHILYESIAVFRKADIGDYESCSEPVNVGSGEKGYFFESSYSTGVDFNSFWPACTQDTGINFLERTQETGLKTLGLVYGSNSPIANDFKTSSMVYKGYQRFFLAHGPNFGPDEKRMLNQPVEFRVFHGKLYDYLATTNTLTIVSIAQKGPWNNWQKLQAFWNQEQAMYNKIKGEDQKSTIYNL